MRDVRFRFYPLGVIGHIIHSAFSLVQLTLKVILIVGMFKHFKSSTCLNAEEVKVADEKEIVIQPLLPFPSEIITGKDYSSIVK